MIHKRSTALKQSVKIFYWRAQTGPTAPALPPAQTRTKTHRGMARTKDKTNFRQGCLHNSLYFKSIIFALFFII